jgi:hypothetical protein
MHGLSPSSGYLSPHPPSPPPVAISNDASLAPTIAAQGSSAQYHPAAFPRSLHPDSEYWPTTTISLPFQAIISQIPETTAYSDP